MILNEMAIMTLLILLLMAAKLKTRDVSWQKICGGVIMVRIFQDTYSVKKGCKFNDANPTYIYESNGKSQRKLANSLNLVI